MEIKAGYVEIEDHGRHGQIDASRLGAAGSTPPSERDYSQNTHAICQNVKIYLPLPSTLACSF